MAIDFKQKEWKDYPDTSTPIMAAELNRMEKAVGTLVKEFQTQAAVSGLITHYILNGISALHPEYEQSYHTITATPATTLIPSGGVPYLSIDKPASGFEVGYDGLLITVDSLLLAPANYSVTDSGTQITIEFHTSFTNGQTLTCTLYHKPKSTGSGAIAGQARILANGTAESINGETYAVLNGTTKSVVGTAREITEIEEE